jgi:hypothetical protein
LWRAPSKSYGEFSQTKEQKNIKRQLEFTVEDDGVFAKPWSAAVSYRRQGAEMVCAENPNEYFHGRRAAVPTADKPDF